MLRLFIAITPVLGVIFLPLIIPFVISWFGIAPGILTALVLSTLWFIIMLRTSEMPH